MALGFYLSKLDGWRESFIITLVGWIPLAPGRFLRRLFYRSILGRIGTATWIETGVRFVNADHVELGHEVRIDQLVRVTNLGRNTRIQLDDGVFLAHGVELKTHPIDGGKIEIGEHTSIGPHSCLSGHSIKIGKNCLVAHYVGIFANNHVFTDPIQPIREQGHTYKGIVIEDDCWLGTGVKVLDGVKIGRGSVVGAGAVVTKDLPPYSIAVGIPAKVVAWRDREAVHKYSEHSQSAHSQSAHSQSVYR